MTHKISQNFFKIPLKEIDCENTLTDFSLSPPPEPLADSLREIGVIHPVVLKRTENGYQILCGHRRATLLASLGCTDIPARILQTEMNDADKLALNLTENQAHRQYSDIEKGGILSKLAQAGIPENAIIEKYMPLLSLQRSKKLVEDFSRIEDLASDFKQLLHELNVPIRIFSPLFQWDGDSQNAAETLFSILRPGINKWRDLLELISETSGIIGQSPKDMIRHEEIQSILAKSDSSAHEKYDQIFATLFPRRHPALAVVKQKVARTLDQLKLGDQTKIRVQESFETEDIRIEVKARDQKSLIDQADKLQEASRSEAMAELLRILKELQ